ncbi:hypothetical protein CVT26_001096 [Gymnopilus dilepis]|uniref:Tyr recombinase domain-containing protein n=1 Tax=Gymnopilus dilepis TaxID=231916 RepID=A0A409X3L8_9AGAR|nr:hypothetical protein CVT26_001096 [Gymnopilus dilepis]
MNPFNPMAGEMQCWIDPIDGSCWVPSHELNNPILSTTIISNPDLFAVITPVRVSTFRNLLLSHPNRPLVDSVCEGLVYGFWPWADTADSNLPMSLDVEEYVKEPIHVAFAEEQRAKEISFGSFSPTFFNLLPGMLCVPITVSTKARSNKLRLCVNHSAEPFARNSLIPREAVSVPLDNLHNLGAALRRARARLHPDTQLVVWKSDVKRAYRTIPMSPYWQAKQVVKINGSYNVDRCNNFGGRAGGGLWGYFFGLVLWIAIFMLFIEDLFAYVDDSFSWDVEGNLVMYRKYNRLMPVKQARFLSLLDLLNIPHDDEKQLWGRQLTIIGFDVDPNAMTITMPDQSRRDLVNTIRDFAVPGRRLPLSSFRQLAGWINWALNVYPLLRPGLSALYEKMAGKERASALLRVSVRVSRELIWVADHMEASHGLFMMDSVEWPLDTAPFTLYTDASMLGLGFWCPELFQGFQCRVDSISSHSSVVGIFYWEALAVLSAINWLLSHCQSAPRRVVIYCDNTNCVDMFSSLRASSIYNPILITFVNLLLFYDTQCLVVSTEPSNIPLSTPSSFAGGNLVMNFLPSARQPSRPAWSLDRLRHERAIALGFALEPGSISSYSSAFHSYLAFCTSHGFSVEPTPDTLSFYVVYTCHFIKPASVRSYLSGICNQLEPFYPSVRAVRKHPLVVKTLTGCIKLRATPTSRKRPLTRAEIGEASAMLKVSASHDDKLFRAILTTSFHGMLRLGESVQPDRAALRDSRKVILRSTVTVSTSSFAFLLPTHKADRLFEGNRVLINMTSTPDDPFSPFTSYLSSRDSRFPLNPELWLKEDGTVPTRRWFINRLHSFFSGNIGGHSLRAGGATAYASAGIPLHLIQAMGRWSSDAFLIYIRKHPTLLASLVSATSRNAS